MTFHRYHTTAKDFILMKLISAVNFYDLWQLWPLNWLETNLCANGFFLNWQNLSFPALCLPQHILLVCMMPGLDSTVHKKYTQWRWGELTIDCLLKNTFCTDMVETLFYAINSPTFKVNYQWPCLGKLAFGHYPYLFIGNNASKYFF